MQDFFKFIKEYPAFISLVAIFFGLVGIYIGNMLAIGRDKRKEWNALIGPIRDHLIKKPGIHTRDLSDVCIIDIKSHLCFLQRRGFDKAVAEYKKSIGNENRKSDGMGGFHYIDTQMIIRSSSNLLKYLKKK